MIIHYPLLKRIQFIYCYNSYKLEGQSEMGSGGNGLVLVGVLYRLETQTQVGLQDLGYGLEAVPTHNPFPPVSDWPGGAEYSKLVF